MTEPIPARVALVPAQARDVEAGETVHTFDGDLPVLDVHTTPSGFRLFFLPDQRIRPYRPDDVVYLVTPASDAA